MLTRRSITNTIMTALAVVLLLLLPTLTFGRSLLAQLSQAMPQQIMEKR